MAQQVAQSIPPQPPTSPPPPRRPRRERPPPITLTDKAAARIRELVKNDGDDTIIGVRLGVRRRGCNGLSYTMNYARQDTVQPMDEVVTEHGVTVYVDSQAVFYLVGTQMDYVENDLGSEFVFKNPKAKGSCGCGESFNV